MVKKTALGCTLVVKHLLFSKFYSIPTFDFDFILGSFFTFWGTMGFFQGWGRVQKLFWGLLIQTNNFCFLSFALFLLYHVVLSLWWWVVPSNYLFPTQLQFWLFCCWDCGCCWAVTTSHHELGNKIQSMMQQSASKLPRQVFYTYKNLFNFIVSIKQVSYNPYIH